jgi:hypothetical protein
MNFNLHVHLLMTEGRLANEGKWDIPTPEINPLGSQNLYQTTRYEKGLRVHGISYIENITENTKNVKDNKFRTSIDMLNVINQCYSADRDTIAAYNIGASIFASILEGDALTAKDKASFLHLWARAPEDASLQLIPCFDLPGEEIITGMKDSGYPEKLINSVKKAKKMIITLDTPVVFDGQKRWAWVEINPDTYEIISVMDTGEHGATEFISLKGLVDDAGKFELGSFIGFVLSIWSVAIYSLELDNYNNILANAYVFAKGIGEYLDWVMKGYSAVRDMKVSVWDGLKLATGEDIKGDLPVFPEIKIDSTGFNLELSRQRIVNFKKGYDFAFKVYFTSARMKKQQTDTGDSSTGYARYTARNVTVLVCLCVLGNTGH